MDYMNGGAEPSDDQLMAQAKAGDKQAYVTLFHRHKRKVYTYLARYTDDDDRAKDLTLEAFLMVYTNLAKYRPEGKFLPWVYTIATNLAKKEFRKRKQRAEISLDEPMGDSEASSLGDAIVDEINRPDQVAMRGEVRELIEKALSKLDEKYRQTIILCDVNGFSYEEAASILHSNAKTIGTQVRRARKMLYCLLMRYKAEFWG